MVEEMLDFSLIHIKHKRSYKANFLLLLFHKESFCNRSIWLLTFVNGSNKMFKKHCENRKTLPWEHHIGYDNCQIAFSKNTEQFSFFFTAVTVVRKIKQPPQIKIRQAPIIFFVIFFFLSFLVLSERAIWHIWQLMWCSQGSVLRFSLAHLGSMIYFSWGCVIFFAERLRDCLLRDWVIFCVKRFLNKNKFWWIQFFGHNCHYCHYRFVERLPDFFVGEVACFFLEVEWFLCGEVAWFLCVERLWDFSHSPTQVTWFIFLEVAWLFLRRDWVIFFERLRDFFVERLHHFLWRGCMILFSGQVMWNLFCWKVAWFFVWRCCRIFVCGEVE